ncbi:class I SAM-dependent methyltransferase [Actinoplanes sp. NBC_00393]|uniref:class I SAM-dependent methyltransferase n=1 Tax=Actinoplanes sp. NBC_00393 TaxID=2975953 RepID=UPI002E23436F
MTASEKTRTVVGSGTGGLPVAGLRDFYDDPRVPLAGGGLDRTDQMLFLLDGIVRAAPRQLRILDVGCGDGAATSQAAARAPGHQVIGMDWSDQAMQQARRHGLTLIRGGLEAPGLPIADATVDVVVMSEVIEHLVDPDLAVSEALRVLRPGGHLLLSTPNLAAWFNRALLAVGVQPVFSEVSLRNVYGRPGNHVAGHLRLYTARALAQFLAGSGFTDVTLTGAGYHDVPRSLRPFDRMMRRWPSGAAILLAQARKHG